MKQNQPFIRVNTLSHALGTSNVLSLANLRGSFHLLPAIIKQFNPCAVLLLGDNGIFSEDSIEKFDEKTLRFWLNSSVESSSSDSAEIQAVKAKLLNPSTNFATLKSLLQSNAQLLSRFPSLASGEISLSVPVFCTPGVCEDISILENIRAGLTRIPNFFIVDESTTHLLTLPNAVKIRLYGLQGIINSAKLWDVGEGKTTIAGGQGKIWSTALQIGELVELAQRVQKKNKDPTEIRVLMAYSSTSKDTLLAQLASVLQADYTITGGLRFKYTTSYSDSGVNVSYDAYRERITAGSTSMLSLWDSVKTQVEQHIASAGSDEQNIQNLNFLAVINRLPPAEEPSEYQDTWHFNLSDFSYGSLVLNCTPDGIATEIKNTGISFANRAATLGPASEARPLLNTPAPPKFKNPVNGKNTAPPAKSSANGEVSAQPNDRRDKENMQAASTSHTNGTKTKPVRNPNTLKISDMSGFPVTHDDIKSYFGPEIASNISFIKFLTNKFGPGGKDLQKDFAYVEFKTAEAMNQAHAMPSKPFKDGAPLRTQIQQDREQISAKESPSPSVEPTEGANKPPTRGGFHKRGGGHTGKSRGGFSGNPPVMRGGKTAAA